MREYQQGYIDALNVIKICLEEGMPNFQLIEQINDELEAVNEEEQLQAEQSPYKGIPI